MASSFLRTGASNFIRDIILGASAVLAFALAPVQTGAQAALFGAQHADSTDTTLASSDDHGDMSERVSPDSPRASVQQFLALAGAARFEQAAQFLALPDSLRADGAMYARKLKAVLDRHANSWVEDLSPLAAGDTTDGLAKTQELVGIITLADGARSNIRLQRTVQDTIAPWRFTANTVRLIPVWYAELPDRWVLEHLPPQLVRTGPFDILWWQWIALPVLLAIAAVIGWLASHVVRGFLSRLVARTESSWDDAILASVQQPIRVALTLVAFGLALPLLSLYPPAAALVYQAIRAAYFVLFFWALWRLIDVARMLLTSSRWASASTSSRALLPLGARVIKVLVLAVAVVGLLSLLGYPVASLLAGLGLGGLALALAAQKTVENLFGAFSIGIDQPFREGDFVRVDDFVGTVEAVGLRATRFRTLDRTLISMPNGRLADMRLESFSARDRMRLATTIGLVYETTAAQMREVLEGFERVLRAQPKTWPDSMVVKFSGFGASSLDIEIMAWFMVPEWSQFQAIRQHILLQFMEVVENAGSDFAFPTRTLHVASIPDLGSLRPSTSAAAAAGADAATDATARASDNASPNTASAA